MTVFVNADREADQRIRDHLVRVRIEEELRLERIMGTWYDQNAPRRAEHAALFAEHRIRLELLERLAAE